MARRSRDAGPARRSRGSSPEHPRSGTPRQRSATEGGAAREDEDDREHRAFHARVRARKAEAEDRARGSTPPRR
jgi:hypothetical protein